MHTAVIWINPMANIKFILILFLMVFYTNAFSKSIYSDELQSSINYFSDSCDDEDVIKFYKGKPRPNRLLLIDATDPLSSSQKQYLKDNYINGTDWQNKGERFSIVLLDNKDISKLNRVTLCSPMREDQISWWADAPKKEKKIIKVYKETINGVFDTMVSQETTSNSTRLIETLYQIYTNKRFNFLTGKRKLLITSDLVQNSNEVKLFCSNGKCPSFNTTYKKKKSWFNLASLGLKPEDQIELYYFQAKCKVNLHTLKWWEDYFIHEKLSTDNFYLTAENGSSNVACKNTKSTGPGPTIIIGTPGGPDGIRRGGFTSVY